MGNSVQSSNRIIIFIGGIVLLAIGTIAFFPFKCLNLASFGLIQMAVSPKIVSGRVVAIVKRSSLPSILYFI